MKLILDDGKEFEGESFGYPKEVQGEVVFNTGMTGYVETLTDPSYKGQILAITYPLVGNYGVPKGPFESGQVQVQGLIVTHYCENPSHFTNIKTLGQWLKDEGVPAITNVDTRTLTRHLRHNGSIRGRLLFSSAAERKSLKGKDVPIEYIDMNRVTTLVTLKKVQRYGDGSPKILMIDMGGKENIVRSLVERGASVIRTPWNSKWEDLLDECDGVFLTNGPGDPLDAGVGLIERIRNILTIDKPIMGICFGNQLLALAAGGRTFKMKFGHRSVNQPVKDLMTGRCFITSQNHGYVVQTESLPPEWKPWFVNLNDGTNEGIRHVSKKIWSVQFHPEASPGPNDTSYLFDDYISAVKKARKTKPVKTRAVAKIKKTKRVAAG